MNILKNLDSYQKTCGKKNGHCLYSTLDKCLSRHGLIVTNSILSSTGCETICYRQVVSQEDFCFFLKKYLGNITGEYDS